jgi:serine protease
MLTVPDFGASAARTVSDATLDDVAWQARDAGRLQPGQDLALAGRVGGDDRRDVFALAVPAGHSFGVFASPGVRVELFDAALATGVAGATAHAPVGLFSREDARLHIVVAALAESIDYRVDVRSDARLPAAVQVPLAAGAPLAASALQEGYLGADHEMVAGEVIALHEEGFVGIASAELSALGLVADAAVPGPIQRYRLAPARPPLAGPAVSPQLQTCLAAHRLAQVAGVRTASPNYVYRAMQAQTPNDPLFVRQWHYDQIRAPQAWTLFPGTPGSSSVIVAIVDTGMVLAHPDFAGRLTGGYDMISDAARALDGDGIDPDPDDPGDNFGTALPSSFHGTHVGGTVGAATNNGSGVAGMDWACRLMPMRVLGRGGSGTLEDIAQGIRFAAGLSNASGTVPAQRCDVMNLSLGGPGAASVLQAACEAASTAGVLLVVAAGNDNSSTPNFPASFDVCLSVGAIRFDFARAPYSNFASTVDVVAPGGDVTVDQNEDGDPDGVLSCLAADGPPIQLGFGYLQGTSMACPHVAGLAALVKAKGSPSASAVRGFIENNTFASGPSTRIVDAFAAVQAAGGAATTPVLSVAPGNVGLREPETTATVALSNIGVGTLALTAANVAYLSGSNWITAAVLEGPGNSSISHTTLRVTVSRAGLADGRYEATITLVASNAASVVVPVTLFVGTTQSGGDTIFVAVFDETTLANGGQTTTDAAANYAWTLPSVAPGRYFLVAGTDRDNDDELGDEGELFGIWPSNDTPQILTLTGNPSVLSGLDFTVALQNVQQSVGAPRRLPVFRLRR